MKKLNTNNRIIDPTTKQPLSNSTSTAVAISSSECLENMIANICIQLTPASHIFHRRTRNEDVHAIQFALVFLPFREDSFHSSLITVPLCLLCVDNYNVHNIMYSFNYNLLQK